MNIETSAAHAAQSSTAAAAAAEAVSPSVPTAAEPTASAAQEAVWREELAEASAVAATCGAAGLSLIDAACRPGTLDFAAARSSNEQLLQRYRELCRELDAASQAKPDMIAFKKLRCLQREGVYGHIPGVAISDAFCGRGELAVLGLHSQLIKGIDHKSGCEHGAMGIIMAGGYRDNTDDGSSFWYTGTGGRKPGTHTQVRDQTFSNPSNAALLNNNKSNTPVRVFRGQTVQQQLAGAKAPKLVRVYTYEGLYKVVDYRRVPGQDGVMVCQFRLKGVAGHWAVTGQLQSAHLFAAPVDPAADSSEPATAARKRQRSQTIHSWRWEVPSPSDISRSIESRAAANTHGRLVVADISRGQEKVPIPMWNDMDDDDSVPTGHLGPSPVGPAHDTFTYLVDYSYAEEEARELAMRAEQHFRRQYPGDCGILYNGCASLYTDQGRLTEYVARGVMECDPSCPGPTQQHGTLGDPSSALSYTCQDNAVVAQGIKYPLEVFKVKKTKSWGVRCAADVPKGAFLCCYVGTIVTDRTAERLQGVEQYLIHLDHFCPLLANEDVERCQQGDLGKAKQQQQQQQQGGEQQEDSAQQQQQQQNPSSIIQQQQQLDSERSRFCDDPGTLSLPPLPASLEHRHLVVDASHEGNVARFINNSRNPNCMLQPVLTKLSRSHHLYYNAVVATEDIPAFTEITCNHQQEVMMVPSSQA